MCAIPTEQENTDQNGNVVRIANGGGFRVNISGRNNTIRVENADATAKVNIRIRGDGNNIEIEKCILKDFSLVIGSHQPVHGVNIRIGKNFSIEPGGVFEVFTNFAQVHIGEQCMLSRNVTLHFGDNPHLIFDKESGEYSDGNGAVTIGSKVWVGEGVYLSKRAAIADECIVAARSVVTRSFPVSHCVIGGNPARVVKEGIQWFRNRTSLPRPSIYAGAIDAYDSAVEERSAARVKTDLKSRVIWAETWPKGATLLLGVGAMKAGTSWLYDYLSAHPEVHFSPQKEVHYFDVLTSRSERHHLNAKIRTLADCVSELQSTPSLNIAPEIKKVEKALANIQIYKNGAGTHEEYRSYLTKRLGTQRVIGDITPSYCALSEKLLAEMYALAPSVKFVFVMRDPVDRLWSAVRMRAKQMGGDFERCCCTLSEDIIRNGSHPMLTRAGYRETLDKLRAVAPKEDILILFYEAMFTRETRDKICDFLNIRHHPGSDTKKVNEGRSADIPPDIFDAFLKLLRPEYDAVRQAFPSEVPESWHIAQQSDG